MSDHAHESHTGPIKTPSQLMWTSFFAFVVPVFLIIGFGYDNVDITVGDFVAVDIYRFLESEGNRFNLYKGNISLRTSTLNRGIMPDRGWSQTVGLEVAVPGSDYTFYKLSWDGERYFPISRRWTLRTRADVGYGDGYGDNYGDGDGVGDDDGEGDGGDGRGVGIGVLGLHPLGAEHGHRAAGARTGEDEGTHALG